MLYTNEIIPKWPYDEEGSFKDEPKSVKSFSKLLLL